MTQRDNIMAIKGDHPTSWYQQSTNLSEFIPSVNNINDYAQGTSEPPLLTERMPLLSSASIHGHESNNNNVRRQQWFKLLVDVMQSTIESTSSSLRQLVDSGFISRSSIGRNMHSYTDRTTRVAQARWMVMALTAICLCSLFSLSYFSNHRDDMSSHVGNRMHILSPFRMSQQQAIVTKAHTYLNDVSTINDNLDVSSNNSTTSKQAKQHSFMHRHLQVPNVAALTAAMMNVITLPLSRQRHHHHHHHQDEVGTSHYPPVGCESTVLLMRHCEKGDIQEHCSYTGYQRAAYLSTLFGPHSRWPTPTYIYATSAGPRGHAHKKMNFREIETAAPLALVNNLTMDDKYDDEQIGDLAKVILDRIKSAVGPGEHDHETTNLCGKVQVVIWKHSNIGRLARHLGCGHHEGCPIDYKGRTFDDVWQIRFVNHAFTLEQHSTTKHLKKHRNNKHRSVDIPVSHPQWTVYGYVTQQNFDPLAFSHMVGDYSNDVQQQQRNDGDDPIYVNWRSLIVNVPERKHRDDIHSWKSEIPNNLVRSQ
jgi:hypothetical protein